MAGDGNCFYRALLFALLEHIVSSPDPALNKLVQRRCAAAWALIQESSGRQQQQQQGEGGGAGAGGEKRASEGHDLLLRLCNNMWFVQPDLDKPVDLEMVEQLFNDRARSNAVIKFVRLVASRELKANEKFYEPFINGCGSDYSGLSVPQICSQHVERMHQDVEQLQIIALIQALGVCLGILDVAHSEIGYIKHGGGAQGRAPAIWVVHVPGHYDIVYPRTRFDVLDGQLVPASEGA